MYNRVNPHVWYDSETRYPVETWKLKRAWIFPKCIGEDVTGQPIWTGWFSGARYYERSDSEASTTLYKAKCRYPADRHGDSSPITILFRDYDCEG